MQKPDNLELFGSKTNPNLSIIIPTYNESENIINLLKSIKKNIGNSTNAEIIVVDDNSPDGTGKLVDDYIDFLDQNEILEDINEKERKGIIQIRTIHRAQKEDLIQAVLHGIKSSYGEHILIMDADFSHPPETIPKIIEKLQSNDKCIIVASRYIEGSSIEGWKLKRRLISSSANSIARISLGIRNIKDPMSGFFAFHKSSIENIQFTTKGYKILLEFLVKSDKSKVIEIPYAFTDRKIGKSKMNHKTMLNYLQSIWKLYRYGNRSSSQNESNSIKFISKTGRFFTVGASGLLVNYVISMLLSSSIHTKLWYMESTFIGIVVSITSNFILNKFWTFEDRDFSFKHFMKQYLSFILICSLGASLQLTLVYVMMESKLPYFLSLLFAVIGASVSNFLLNKKVTFKEKIWG
ncbi:MAG TPA: glycosyltransferase family 2 protein [Candidatus Nitrosocosmicus sp.]